MEPGVIIDVFRGGMYLIVTLVSIIVLPGLVVGLLVAMFQAATQINEMSLAFIPKLLVTLVTLGVAAPWILKLMIAFTQNLITEIPTLIG